MGNTYGTPPKQDGDEDEDSTEETTGSDSRNQQLTGGESTKVEGGLKFGDIVHDLDDSNPEDLVVVNLPDKAASEWNLSISEEFLAERDDHYPPNDDVVIVVEQDILDNYLPEWSERNEEIPLSRLDDEGIDYDVFPSERLKIVERK